MPIRELPLRLLERVGRGFFNYASVLATAAVTRHGTQPQW